MKELELFDRAMNVSYNMLMGIDEQIIPSDSDEIEDMVVIPDPEATELEIAKDLLDYFESTEEYEKCANIRDLINLNKTLDICLK
jgi:threonine dehydratase